MPDIKAGLTKKVGPLPVWGYGLAVTGGLLGWKLLSGGKSSDTKLVATPTGAPDEDPSYPSSGAFSQLIDRMADLENRGREQPIPIANPVRSKPLSKRHLAAHRSLRAIKRRTGGQILTRPKKKLPIVRRMIPRSSRPIAPPPSSSAPRRAPVTRLPTSRRNSIQPISATSRPKPKPQLKAAPTRVVRNSAQTVRRIPAAIVRRPAPRPQFRPVARPAPRPVVTLRKTGTRVVMPARPVPRPVVTVRRVPTSPRPM